MQLRDYQTKLIDDVAKLYGKGVRRALVQSSTGSGKTIAFSALTQRFLNRLNRRVLICVHRKELLEQTRATLHSKFGIASVAIDQSVKTVPYAQVYVGMVETVVRRLHKNSGAFGAIGLLIVDEAHIGNFTKLYDYFPITTTSSPTGNTISTTSSTGSAPQLDTLILGFTATPISADKRKPLNMYFDEIVTTVDIPEMIANKALCQNQTWSIKGIKRKSLKIKNGKFDEDAMGKTYSTPKNIKNALVAYQKYSLGKKTIVFNCNVAHSKLVNEAFLEAGFNSKHLDGSESDTIRESTMHWLKTTPDAILHNVGIATTGLDVTDIHTVIVNRATLSLTLWLQMVGRGARIHPSKEFFTCIDLGGNALAFGDWSIPRDWKDIFHNPEKASEGGGVAPIKECDGCEAILATQTRICPFCGHDHIKQIEYDSILPDFELITSRIDVEKIAARTEAYGHKQFKGFYDILHTVISITKGRVKPENADERIRAVVFATLENKVREWTRLSGKKYNQWMKDFTSEQFGKEWDKMAVRIGAATN